MGAGKLCLIGTPLSLVWAALVWTAPPAMASDPYAANNALYPTVVQWHGPYRNANYDFPETASSNWLTRAPRDLLTVDNAAAYVNALKTFVEPSLEAMIDTPDRWDPVATNWYSMPWTAEIDGSDATSGREAILGSFSGQVIQGSSFDAKRAAAMAMVRPVAVFPDLVRDMQNHTVIYYDPVAATMLRNIWRNPFAPDANAAKFPEGSLVTKAGAVTATPADWPVVAYAPVWHVFRPPFTSVGESPPPVTPLPAVTELRALQFDMIVKDTKVAPKTGWVFITWIYDRNAPGARPWDRFVPLGAMWGNDPEFARNVDGKDRSEGPLKETWINPEAPAYGLKTLGWGGRLSGPIDVALRHGVVLTNGQVPDPSLRASSCLSCHGTSQYPFVANLYPSPNKVFPQDGKTFLLYPPGSPQWAEWFADRDGATAQSRPVDPTAIGLDYDMLLTFALSNFNNAAGNRALALTKFRVH